MIDLGRFGIAISRGSALDGVEDVNVRTLEPACFDHLRQQLTCFAHEWSASTIFISAGRFAKEGNTRRCTSLSEDGLLSAIRQDFAASATCHLVMQSIKLKLALVGRKRLAWISLFK
jgi:hypothetical protein